MPKSDFFKEALQLLEAKNLKRRLRPVEGAQGPRVVLAGREVLNLCSNNYLGLADDLRLKEAAIEAVLAYGVGSGASRLVCGDMAVMNRLEQKLAESKGTESALVFNTGYTANVGILSSVFGRGDLIVSDRLNHASIVDGILLSGADWRRYPHADMPALEEILKGAGTFKKKVIVTDSVFSMDGDIAPLDKIVELAKAYGAWVMVDEAHAFGVLGKNGRGAAEHFGLEKDIDIQMGTLSKAAGVFGAYVCGSRELREFLINRARSFVYTTALPPAVAAAALKAIEIVEAEPERRERLLEKAHVLRQQLAAMGFDTMQSQTPIIPILVKDETLAVTFSQELLERGIFVQAIRPPTVPAHTARLRVTVMATHTDDDLNFAVAQFKEIGKKLCLI